MRNESKATNGEQCDHPSCEHDRALGRRTGCDPHPSTVDTFGTPTLEVRYAYSRRPGHWTQNNNHYVALQEIRVGRLHRHPNQTLCSTKRWWGLERPDGAPMCAKCAAIKERYKL